MIKSSRYNRPETPVPLRLQPRDRAILLAVFRHRYLTLGHLRAMFFDSPCPRAAQLRLRKLWATGHFDRRFLPFFYDGTDRSKHGAGRPLYSLARKGAEVVSVETGLQPDQIPHTPSQNAVGFATLKHHLVATDFLVAVETACRTRQDVVFESMERETGLRRALARCQQGKHAPAVVSDGAFTFRYPHTEHRWTFHIEIVRAGTRGGNKTLLNKLRKYANLHHAGFFRRVFGHATVRAVLIATTSQTRALGLRDLAATLPHCRGMFWFGTYDNGPGNDPAFNADNVLDQPWHGADGGIHTLAPAGN